MDEKREEGLCMEPLRLKNQLCFPLYACSKEVIRQYRPFLEELDLTYTQYLVMMVMWEHESISIKDLGELLYLDSGTLTPVVRSLEKKGYVSRNRDNKTDLRLLMVRLTEEGRALSERALEVPGQIAQCICLSPEKAAQLYELLYRDLA